METVDYDVEGGNAKTKAVAQGSKLLLLAETITAGMETKDFKSKKIEATSEEIAIGADKTFEAKDAVQGTELTMNKVEAKQSFKSMNIKDGM